ncbi:TolC family protein [Ginsengibacter hankyongi]|uniref:TolC family protein n=1 Tax=Ginsengibacter hankyongi TaxID=2607284 RepID=A0A5J5II47_9BACT|nr:TolC family protein [Ginsengibacter hankyongi]KAA9040576.1 TolC family protein [Ginsengibacter hankyongi]
MNRRRHFILAAFTTVIIFNAVVLKVSAQDSLRQLSLSDAIAATLNNNKRIQLAKLDENIAASNYKQTEAIYLPQVGFSYTAMSTDNPLNAFGFKLQQKSITQNDFNPDLLNHPSGTPDFTTKLEVQQPLINMDILYKRKAAAKQIELYQYKTQRTKEYLTFEVQKAYLQLQLAYDAVKVLEEALQTTNSVYTFTDNHFKQGLIQKSDLLNAQVQVTTVETNLAKAKSNIRNASDYLSLLMGQGDGVIYKPENTLQQETPANDTATKIASSRSDFLAMQKAIETSDLMIKSSKMSYLPKLNAFGSYQFNDRQALGFGANAYLAGIQLSWDIFKGNRTKNTIATQTLERNKLSEELAKQKDESQLELDKAYRDLADASFNIKQQKLAIEQASESLMILQNRYQQGLVNTTDVLMATNQLSQQKFALAQAIFTSNITKAYLQLLKASTK